MELQTYAFICNALKEIVADGIYKDETKETVEDFLKKSTFNKNLECITTDLDKKYGSIIENMGSKHQHCLVHAERNFNKRLYDLNLPEDKYETAKEQLKKITNIFHYNDYKKADKALQELYYKKEEFLPEVWKIARNSILPHYKKFIHHIKDNKIPETSNLIENLFSKTMPKHRKRTFKTIDGIMKRIHLTDQIWNENNII